MIPDDKLAELRDAVKSSAKPLIFYDDDPDGVCSYILFHSLNPQAQGIIFKAAGSLDKDFAKKANKLHPDRVFILDVPKVEQEFLDKVPDTYWLDHHSPNRLNNVKYFNPMVNTAGDNRPTSYWAYKIAQKKLWVAMVGCVGDWYLPPDLKDDFIEQYPDLLSKEVTTPEEALFGTPVGRLARIISFGLKGTVSSSLEAVEAMTKIEVPKEILEQTTDEGKLLWKKYKKIDDNYQELKASVKVTDDPIILHKYYTDQMSLTSDLSNEILYEHPDKFIIIGREKDGQIKCSLRSKSYEVRPRLEKALQGIDGKGGGHLHACGGAIKADDFEQFVENIRELL